MREEMPQYVLIVNIFHILVDLNPKCYQNLGPYHNCLIQRI